MNPETFFENFDLLCEAPNGIEKLRELILQLAVMGKLVPQDPNDEPASVLLEKIKAEKQRCIISKEIQADKKLSPIIKETPPWIIPPSWEWIRFQEIFEITRGGSPRPAGDPQYFGGDIPWITVKEITKDSEKYLTITTDFLTELGSKRSRYIYPLDLLLTNSGATLGVPKISKIKGCINDGVARLNCFHDLISKDYAYYYLSQQTRAFREVNQGMGQPNLNTSILAGWFLPLPPLAEQKCIVTKVDELMVLCDKLEARRRKKQEIKSKLNSAALERMLKAENQEEFGQHWQRICENFDLLYDNPENVEKLRQAILQLAVQGKLVEQNPEDEPASVLIEKIGTKKRQMVKEGKIKKVSPLKQVSECEFPFDLPKNWIWIRLGDGLLKLTDGTHHSPTNESTGDFKYITAKNIKTDGIDLTNITYVTSKIHEEIYSRCDPEYGDILYIKDGATTGVTVINDLEEQFSMLSSVALMKLPSEIENKYLLYMLRSPYFYSLMREGMSGVAITRVTLTKLNNALVPLPPLNEQKRIVEIVEQFMGLCDELESKLRKEREDSEKLMETVVRGLLEGVVAEI
ncbi:Type I restriction-modification system, specificity subunit S [Methanosarcina siciliae HI350]|uniref:Type I restriction-modification system, specificity subunit S n=1 Tax=Methanosarcina siciliae HI350 TaxID=1434119 RepID=A0A0E3PEN2_9EURY|nr:restriction endonuclease subunit S [Methanosarcina siciliae]AKB32719.1 Type I restriction-modification system, specificity subunit S [Methanosarcina siciliae HI350]